MNKTQPIAGDAIRADGWKPNQTELLQESGGYSDNSFKGCQFIIPMRTRNFASINIAMTGNPVLCCGTWESRCKIEFVQYDEPSTFCNGTIYHHKSI